MATETCPTHSVSTFIRTLEAAVHEEERAAPHRGQPDSLLQLEHGELRGSVNGRTHYQFLAPDLVGTDLLHQGGTLTLNQRVFSATILQIFPPHVVIAIDGDNQGPIPQATFGTSSVVLLAQLRQRLNAMLAHPDQFQGPLALTAFQPAQQSRRLSRPYHGHVPEQLNPGQQEAFTRSQTDATLFIWGPPGTGKTTVISAIIEERLKQGKRVLLCSNTNAAVDQALGTALGHLPDAARHAILRIGKPWEHADPGIASLTLDAKIRDASEPLNLRLDELQSTIQSWEAILTKRRANDPAIQHWQAHHQTVDTARQAHLEAQTDLQGLHAQLLETEKTIRAYRQSLQRSRVTPLFATQQSQVTSPATWHDCQTTMTSLSRALLAQRTQHEETQRRVEHTRQTLETVLAEDHALALSCGLTPPLVNLDLLTLPFDVCEGQLFAFYEETERIHQQLAALEHRVLNQAQCLATTMTRASSSRLFEDQRFDSVIVDEASMPTPPALYATLALATEQIILVGDPLQLPPIAFSKTSQVQTWMARSVYDVARIHHGKDPRCVALDTQYRMHPDIAQLAQPLYYRRQVAYHTDPSVQAKRLPITNLAPFPRSAVSWIDSSASHPVIQRNEQGSPYNWTHALLILKLLHQLLEQPHPQGRPTISVLTPYRAQVFLLQRLLARTNFAESVTIGTIHQIQGQQADIVILDTTVVHNLTRSLLCQPYASSAGTNLLNVAITRAKSKLIVIGHGPAVSDLPTGTFLRECYEQIQSIGIHQSSGVLLPHLPAQQLSRSLPQEDAQLTAILTQLFTDHTPMLRAV